MLGSLVLPTPHDEPALVFSSNGGSMWPRHCNVGDGGTMLTEPPDEGSSAYNASPCNKGLAVARVHEPDIAMRTKSMITKTFPSIFDMCS